jgi:hypothetical protein
VTTLKKQMSALAEEHDALVHPDGSECPDGCDAPPHKDGPEAVEKLLAKRSLIERFEEQTGNTYDPDGPEPEECEDCGNLFQYVVDSEHGPGHSCHATRCASRAAAREEVL